MKNFFQMLAGLPPAATPAPKPVDQLDVPLLQFGPRDQWTVRDACEGTAVFGATGSGKTSGSGAAIAKSLLRAGCGGLVLCAKTDEVSLWKRYCQETNRSKSLIIFSPTEPWRFNFLSYELSRPGAGAGLTENLVRLFSSTLEVAERGRGGNNHDFWERTTKQLLRNCFELMIIARGRLMLQEIYDLLVSAPTTPEEVNDPAWQESSLCWRCVKEGEAKPKTDRQANDFALAVKYWLREFPALSSKTRSIIVTNLTSMLDLFLRGALRELFCTTTNIVPEVTHEGAILVLDLPVKEFAEVGQLAQMLMKFVWQRASERRDVRKHGRVAFLWADEAQFFVSPRDAEFQSTARSSRIATIYLSQNIGAYYAHIGQSETHSVMGNLQTKLFHANGDTLTNNWSSDLFSKSWQMRASASASTSDSPGRQTVSRNYGASDSLDSEVLPGEFTSLRKGGPEHGYCVEAIAFQGGRIWHATNKNHIKVGFSQR
jgi:type IV secretory pathway TraG/TraD family ATPase VirD4